MWMMYYAAGEIKIQATEVGIPKITDTGLLLDNIFGLVYTAIAAISILFIVRGGLLYVTHGGDAKSTTEARETVLYAVVALVGSTLVFTLINFVLNATQGLT
jgi:hypothetical protein